MQDEWKLTPRQIEVLQLMTKGYSNPEIARLLEISLGTVKAHAGAIINALDVTNRTEAAVLYQEALNPEQQPADTADVPNINLVVLPFSDYSPNKDNQYFSHGLSEELMCSLSSYSGFRIISRTTAFLVKQQNWPIEEISQRLKVSGVVEGSICIDRDELRVNVQLVESKTGFVSWSEVYRTKLFDIFEVQQKITSSIALTLGHKLDSSRDVSTITHCPSFDVYQEYLKGRSFWHQRTPDGILHAIECFQKVVQKDGKYALAYVGLADAYNQIAYYSASLPKALFEQSQTFLEKALQLQPQLAEALASQAYVDMHHHRDFDMAEKRLKQAITVNPSYAYSYGWLSLLFVIKGEYDKAMDFAEQGQKIDALSPAYVAHIGNIHRGQGELRQALLAYEEAINNEVKDPKVMVTYAYTLVDTQQLAKAEAIAETIYLRYKDHPTALGVYAHLMGLCAKKEKTESVLADLTERKALSYVPAMAFVSTHLGLGNINLAMRYLNQAIEEHIPSAMYILAEPSFSPLWSHPDFPSLTKKIRLPSHQLEAARPV